MTVGTAENPTRIIVVDDHPMVRDAIAERLDRESDMSIVATAESGGEATSLAAKHEPDVVLMDIDMPGVNCFDAAASIGSRCPDARVVFLSAHWHDRYIEDALRVGACGYLTKSEPTSRIIIAIREIVRGARYFSPEILDRLEVTSGGVAVRTVKQTRLARLSARELDVLRYLATGLAKKEVAKTMHLSVKTIDGHTSNIMSKLDIHDRVELARYAIREGLTTA